MRSVEHLTPWRPADLRFPPAVYAAFLRAPTEPLHLRSGDVLEVLEARDRPQTIAFQHQDMLRGYAMWTQNVGVLCTMLIRLWDPHWPRPIVTWLEPGTEWRASTLTFSGSFPDSYPGRWVPVAWGPSKILQLVRASDSKFRVHILVEQDDRTFVTTLDPRTSRASIAVALQTQPDHIQVVGVPADCPSSPCLLRDGDIVNSQSPTVSDPIYGWPDDDAGESGTHYSPQLCFPFCSALHYLAPAASCSSARPRHCCTVFAA